MSERITPGWVRISAQSRAELADLGLACATDLIPTDNTGPHAPQLLTVLSPEENGVVRAGGVVWTFSGDGTTLLTVESSERVLRPGSVLASVRGRGLDEMRSAACAISLLRQILRQAEAVQTIINRRTERIARVTHDFLLTMSSEAAEGTDGLKSVDEALAAVGSPQSMIMQSVFDVDRCARQLKSRTSLTAPEARMLAELTDETEAVMRRAVFSASRQRFHWESASEIVTSGNLSINKLFNALWAITIPSTVLINWYGENFRFMPELSWWGTMPVQLIGVFLITILPLWAVKSSGAMR